MLIIIQAGISCKWTNDSQRFLLEHLDTINNSPSHIYRSALPFSPPSTWLQEYYGSELSQEVRVVKGLPVEWGICSYTISLGIETQEISCWNNTVVIGSGQRNIIIVDATTGSPMAILSGHTDEVNSTAFSSDGRSLVSGSDDKTVKFWDIQTGGAIKTFCGHTGLVLSVSISADSTVIVSGSVDCHHTIFSPFFSHFSPHLFYLFPQFPRTSRQNKTRQFRLDYMFETTPGPTIGIWLVYKDSSA